MEEEARSIGIYEWIKKITYEQDENNNQETEEKKRDRGDNRQMIPEWDRGTENKMQTERTAKSGAIPKSPTWNRKVEENVKRIRQNSEKSPTREKRNENEKDWINTPWEQWNRAFIQEESDEELTPSEERGRRKDRADRGPEKNRAKNNQYNWIKIPWEQWGREEPQKEEKNSWTPKPAWEMEGRPQPFYPEDEDIRYRAKDWRVVAQQEREEERERERRIRAEKSERNEGTENTKVVVVGDSLVRYLEDPLQTNTENDEKKRNRKVICKPGATMYQIAEVVEKLDMGNEGGVVVIQGGGNNLLKIGARKTWERIRQAIWEMWEKNKNIAVIIVGITRRCKEPKAFEMQRKVMDEIMEEEVNAWTKERERKGCVPPYKHGVQFVSNDRVVKNRDVSEDGVHLLKWGTKRCTTTSYKQLKRQ